MLRFLKFLLLLLLVVDTAQAKGPELDPQSFTEVESEDVKASRVDDPGLDFFEFGEVKLFLPNRSSVPEVRYRMAQLPPERTARAQALRRWVVQRSGRLLFTFRKPLGVFQSAKGSLKKLIPSKEHLRSWFGRGSNATKEQVAMEEAVAKNDLSKEKIVGVLAGINQFMVESSGVVATSVEEGILLSVGLQGELGGGRFGRGGALMLDIYIGYNQEADALAISLLPRVESFSKGFSASFGVPMKLAYYWAANGVDQAGGRMDGTSIYPPGLPWASLVNELSHGDFAAIGAFALFGADFSGGALPLVNRSKGVRTLRVSIPVGRSEKPRRWLEFGLTRFLEHVLPDLKTIFSGSGGEVPDCPSLLEQDTASQSGDKAA